MNTFLLSFDANTSFAGANPPTLEVLVGGSVVSSVEMQLGANSYDLFIEFTGLSPSSLSFRFAGASGDPGDTIEFTSASINSSPLNLATDLTSTLLTQSQTSNATVDASTFGHTPPTLGPATETGTTGNDTFLNGGDAADVIEGLAGDDRIRGRGDDDGINGGDGDDYIFGEGGNDTILGAAGNDVLFGNSGDDVIFGEDGLDTLIGGSGNDILNGGANDDTLSGNDGNDVLFGEDGNDFIIGDAGDDVLFGDNGADTLIGGDGNDSISGGNGIDLILGEDNDDLISGGGEGDQLIGGLGDDIIDGDAGNDLIVGDTVGSSVILEAGRVSVTQTSTTQFHTVNFTGTIENAVVKVFAEDVSADPFTIRVRNITSTGFEFQLDEYDFQDGVTGLETVSFVAVASGTHTLSNGAVIEAGFTSATNEDATTVNFNNTFTNPIVFSQVSSDNELSAVVTRNDNVTSSGFDVLMQEQESNANVHATEDIGFIVVESGGSVTDGYLAGNTGNVVTDANTTVNFDGTFAAGNPIFLADQQTLDGGDTATVGADNLTNSQVQVFIDEETSANAEVGHTTEDVGYFAINEGVYLGPSELNGSDILRGGDGDDTIYADLNEDVSIANPNATNLLAAEILNAAPVAYFNLNDTGTTADNLGSLGPSVDGTLVGGATTGGPALYLGGGASVDFDGTNDGIDIPDSAGINTSTYPERTVELVFNADDVTSRQVLYEEGGTTNGLTIYLNAGSVIITGADDGNFEDVNFNASVMTNTTYHVAFVFDQPSDSFTGYLDGVNIGSISVGGEVFPSHGGDIGIGYAPDGVQFADGESGSGGFNFDGRISDVAIYNDALTATEIQTRSDIVQGITTKPVEAIDDILYGGDGFDQLYGGGGRDVFVFEAASAFNDVDQIFGFDVGEQDALDISDILTGYTDGVSDINDFVTITTSGSNSLVAVDANGATGGASFTTIAQINNFTGADADALLYNNSIIPV